MPCRACFCRAAAWIPPTTEESGRPIPAASAAHRSRRRSAGSGRGDFRTISGLSFTAPAATATVAPARSTTGASSPSTASFTDGSSGIFVSNRVAVPEPSTLLLLCFGSLAVLWRRRGLVCASILAAVVGISFADRAAADTFGSGANTFDIEFVTIGNPGNAADTTGNPNPAGSVPYTYRMGKFEISEQMIDKANTLGGLGITKDTRGPDKPATSVSWNEAARFVNWLNTSTGSTPAYKFALQPGEAGYNANANIQLWTIERRRLQPEQSLPQQLGAVFPAQRRRVVQGGVLRSDQRRLLRLSNRERHAHPRPWPAARRLARRCTISPFATGPADITLAGGLSPYGTMGQGGNVYEWEETDFDLVNDSEFVCSRRSRRHLDQQLQRLVVVEPDRRHPDHREQRSLVFASQVHP